MFNEKIQLRVAGIVKESIVDGPGLRYTLFLQGCPRRCKGCHNPTTQPFDGGKIMTLKEILNDIEKNPLIHGVTFSGGEPFCQSRELAPLAKELKKRGYSLMAYTGDLWENLILDVKNSALLGSIDILVDGPFVIEKKSLDLHFKGSSNQRIIDVPKSLQSNRVIEIFGEKKHIVEIEEFDS